MFGKYEIRKARMNISQSNTCRTSWGLQHLSCVTGLVNQKKVQNLLSWLPVSALDLTNHARATLAHHPNMGTVLHTWPNGRFVQIQDGFRGKETLGPIKGAHIPWSSLGNGLYIWLPVHRSSKGQDKQTKTISSGNSMPFHSSPQAPKRMSLLRLKESSFVLVALNVTSHLSPHPTILRRSILDSNLSERSAIRMAQKLIPGSLRNSGIGDIKKRWRLALKNDFQ